MLPIDDVVLCVIMNQENSLQTHLHHMLHMIRNLSMYKGLCELHTSKKIGAGHGQGIWRKKRMDVYPLWIWWRRKFRMSIPLWLPLSLQKKVLTKLYFVRNKNIDNIENIASFTPIKYRTHLIVDHIND
jgi:hypothetical protein